MEGGDPIRLGLCQSCESPSIGTAWVGLEAVPVWSADFGVTALVPWALSVLP